MKTSWLAVTFLITVVSVRAQTSAPVTPPAPTPYSVIERGANQNIWQRTTYEKAPDGTTIPVRHHYTELATGLNHLVNGQWVASSQEIDILPDGTAAATNGQHQVYFPTDIYNGQIKMVTPDGKILRSQPLALSYDDGSNTVLIAVLTNSIGELIASNQVLYPNAFVGMDADLRYTYTKAGFEQDIIIRRQPPAPEDFNLNPQTTKLQMLTEFFNPPPTTMTARQLPSQAGMTLNDDSLSFGIMKMGRGKAFLLGADAHSGGAMVAKSWMNVSGRQILIEQVPVMALANDLLKLPISNASTKINAPLHVVSAKRLLPARHLVKVKGKETFVARASLPDDGVVLDYNTINGSLTNYTFQGDSTYYISGYVSSGGGSNNVIIEGGTVIKFARDAGLDLFNPVSCQTSAYRPAILTAMDDNTVGETISGSTGNPSGTYADVALAVENGIALTPFQNLRISYANIGLGCNTNVVDCQFINVATAIMPDVDSRVENVLLDNVDTGFSIDSDLTMNAAFVTAHHVNTLISSGGTLNITNSLFICVTNWGGSFTGAFNATNGSDDGVFQTIGGGSHYLATDSIYRNAGTTNIDPALLADIATKTTYPPIVYAFTTLTNNLILSPVVARDNVGNPDLGYHYDPLDYAFGSVYVTNTILVNPGTAIGLFSTNSYQYGLGLGGGGQLNCRGLANHLIHIAEYNTVQEGVTTNWLESTYSLITDVFSGGSALVNCQFSDWSVMAQDAPLLYVNSGIVDSVQNCQFHGGQFTTLYQAVNIVNCLFDRVDVEYYAFDDNIPSLQNNLFWNGTFDLKSQVTNTLVKNNLFDNTIIPGPRRGLTSQTSNAGHNAYITNCDTLIPVNPNDVILSNSPDYQSSWFGNFYLPSDSPLIDAGSTTADQVGLYHFTTQTNQVPETNSIVDIGYHYVATDGYGNPLDSNGDGIPDYIEDANGNGLVDSGEIGWNIYGDLGLKVIITRPHDGSTLP